MTIEDVRLRDVVEDDLEAFCAYEQDPEAARRSRFTPRPREAFMSHWKERVLADETCFVQTVTVDGDVAGSVVAWWHGDRRFLGYGLGRAYWGRHRQQGSGTLPGAGDEPASARRSLQR